MAYLNLKGEMAKKGITIEQLADFLQIHRNSVSNKIKGTSCFSIEEAEKIREHFFPEFKLQFLFKNEQNIVR